MHRTIGFSMVFFVIFFGASKGVRRTPAIKKGCYQEITRGSPSRFVLVI